MSQESSGIPCTTSLLPPPALHSLYGETRQQEGSLPRKWMKAIRPTPREWEMGVIARVLGYLLFPYPSDR